MSGKAESNIGNVDLSAQMLQDIHSFLFPKNNKLLKPAASTAQRVENCMAAIRLRYTQKITEIMKALLVMIIIVALAAICIRIFNSHRNHLNENPNDDNL